MTDAFLLQTVARAGALFCAGAYLYAFVFRSRGDRRWHTAGLLFTGLSLGALSGLAPVIPASGAPSLIMILAFLFASVVTQSIAAFRGRRGDRRERRAEERAPQAASNAPAGLKASGAA